MYALVGINFGESVKERVERICDTKCGTVYIRDICNDRSTYFDILDTEDMVIERLHILQIVDLLKGNPDLYNSLFLFNPSMSEVHKLGTSYKPWLEHNSSNILISMLLPPNGVIYYKLSDCKRYLAVVSFCLRGEFKTALNDFKDACYLWISVLSCDIDMPIAASEGWVSYIPEDDDAVLSSNDRNELVSFSALDYNGEKKRLNFDLVFKNNQHTSIEVYKRVLRGIIFKNEPSIQDRSKKVSLITKKYRDFISSKEFDGSLYRYKAELIFNR